MYFVQTFGSKCREILETFGVFLQILIFCELSLQNEILMTKHKPSDNNAWSSYAIMHLRQAITATIFGEYKLQKKIFLSALEASNLHRS